MEKAGESEVGMVMDVNTPRYMKDERSLLHVMDGASSSFTDATPLI